MLSKLLPWDMLQKYPQTWDKGFQGPQAFLINDPYLERVFLERLPRGEIKFSLYTGNEINRDFIEEHFINLSFFSESAPILILNSELIPVSVLEFLIESEIDWSEKKLLMFFTKTSKAFTDLAKQKQVLALEIDPPKFWEGSKMWQFSMKARSTQFDGVVSRFALENLEHSFESFFWFIETTNINFPDGKIELSSLKELVSRERFDYFELIDLFHRGPKHFFQEVLKKPVDFDWLRGLMSFMQTHLIKILYPEEILAKSRMSKYEQTLVEMSERLDRKTVLDYLNLFSELEVLSKAQDSLIVERLKLEVLK